ncbi:transposase [Apiospora phragmitis]|uniref:Transposase n=1 Tax=Apiospora phragmitis TaxID=2905665 RepID=A0ABR1SR85_9PEZI
MPPHSYTEDELVDAIFDVTDNGLSLSKSAQKHGIPKQTLSDRMKGKGSREEFEWILGQDSLGYAPSHSQIRAYVVSILSRNGEDLEQHPLGNTVNVDKGGIMAGFGLDRLVVGSSDLKQKALLKGAQTRAWTSFMGAVTADGRALKPGIIFKGKDLQKQWFVEQFRSIVDWYYITSPNGWTDHHIAIEWLKQVYLPQTKPADEGEGRLIILDSHESHTQDEWMAICFLNNVYCCYLPEHTSHGLQPLDNGPFNALKAAYRRELQKLAMLTDSAPVDKVNFIRAYSAARSAILTEKNIKSGWRVTGNWPISRTKALSHPEIQPDQIERPLTEEDLDAAPDSPRTPKSDRQIRDLGIGKSPLTRRLFVKVATSYENQQAEIAVKDTTISRLEEELARAKRERTRRAIPNPNKRFIELAEALGAPEQEEPPRRRRRAREVTVVEEDEDDEDEEIEPPQIMTRSGRMVERRQLS